MPKPSSRGPRAVALTAIAFVWSIGLLVAALAAPAYGGTTLVDENGRSVLLVVAVPAVMSVAVWIALRYKCSRGGRVSGYVAWACVCLLSVLCVVGILTIGVFVAPVAVLLACATSLTPSGSPPGPAAKRLA
ncbi:MAG TPA: hypothetical protein VFF79_00320 [Conexibacter sp.]|jgi:hypothetical protein|nr:hypothetical protein [Conexibacter sp.]